MTISNISSSILLSRASIQPSEQLQAITIFGKELAESLKVRDGTWEKVMESWNISLKAWKTIKESENNFCKLPKLIYCESQVNDGLIFKHSIPSTKIDFTTPHGFIYLEFHDTTSMNQFITRLEETFSKKLLESPILTYSFTLDPNKTATFKHCYDTCGYTLKEEFGKDHYSRTQALNIYKILSEYTGITIEGQTISDNIY